MENQFWAGISSRRRYYMNSVFAVPVPNPGLPMDSQSDLGSILLPEFGAPDYLGVTHPYFYGGPFGTFAECHLETTNLFSLNQMVGGNHKLW